MLPVVTGIVLCSVDKEYAGSANSLSKLIYNIFGRFIGPILYSFFKSSIPNKSSKVPMCMLLNVSVIGFMASLFILKCNKSNYDALREEIELESKIGEKEGKIEK